VAAQTRKLERATFFLHEVLLIITSILAKLVCHHPLKCKHLHPLPKFEVTPNSTPIPTTTGNILHEEAIRKYNLHFFHESPLCRFFIFPMKLLCHYTGASQYLHSQQDSGNTPANKREQAFTSAAAMLISSIG
jgi:hypothetical protein